MERVARGLGGKKRGVTMSAKQGRKALALGVATLALTATGAALGAGSGTAKLSAQMTAGQVVPHKPKGNVAHAAGTFVGTLRLSGARWQLSWHLTYKNLDHP